MKNKKKIIIGFVLFIIIIELFLRFYLGFCDTVLMKSDKDYEYIQQPNQERFRFRNYNYYNTYSMRSQPLSLNSLKILGFGDSVINGGTQTDQKDLATTILSDSLTKKFNKEIQFLNISAGSWGPDNCFSYLKKHGDFNAESIFLFVSSHDAYDNMNHEKIVDKHPSYPSKQYVSAIFELVDRYLIPRIIKPKQTTKVDELGINKMTNESNFNTGFSNFKSYSLKSNKPLVIYLHADKFELKAGKYSEQGQKIIEFAKYNKIPLILDLENGLNLSCFRDNIHLNPIGQRNLANTVQNYILNSHDLQNIYSK